MDEDTGSVFTAGTKAPVDPSSMDVSEEGSCLNESKVRERVKREEERQRERERRDGEDGERDP